MISMQMNTALICSDDDRFTDSNDDHSHNEDYAHNGMGDTL